MANIPTMKYAKKKKKNQKGILCTKLKMAAYNTPLIAAFHTPATRSDFSIQNSISQVIFLT